MTYRSPTQRQEHQTRALAALTQRPRSPCDADVFAWLMDMGTGKTKVTLDEWGERAALNDLSDLLVIAPAGSYRNWDKDHPESPSEITKHLDPELRVRMSIAAWRSGKKTARRAVDDLIRRNGGDPRALVMNVESFSSVEKAREAAAAFIETSRRGVMVAVDESTTIKGYNSTRTEIVTEIGAMSRVAARRILTGLLTPKGPMDVYSQFAFLDPRIIGSKSFFTFKLRYAVTKRILMAGHWRNIIVGYRNIDDLKERIAPYSFRVTKEECLDLPPKVYMSRDVRLTPEQSRKYMEIMEYATTAVNAALEHGPHVTATTVLTQISTLHKLLCGYVVDEDGTQHDVPELRTTELLEILQQHSGKVVVWIPYRRTLRKVSETLRREFGDAAVAEFHGGNLSTRGEDELRFRTDPSCRIMLSTSAGARGNNWTVANLVVYYGNTYDLEIRSQSEDRCHRMGQNDRVTYVDLVARDTVDERIIYALRKKIDLATRITGENYREWLI